MKLLTLKNRLNDTSIYHSNRSLHAIIDRLETANKYSTSERIIGQWTNGATLYEMVVPFGTLPNNRRKTVKTLIPTNVLIKRLTGIAERYANDLHDTRPIENCVTLLLYRAENQEIFIDTNQDQSAWNATIIIDYIKVNN